MEKKRNPRVNLPSYVKDMIMLSPRRDGKKDNVYKKAMISAIHAHNNHKNNSLRKQSQDNDD